jgi:hypothetical protein
MLQSTSFPAHSVTTLSVNPSSSHANAIRARYSHRPFSPFSQIAGSILSTLSVVVYGRMFRRPPIPIPRIASLATFASLGGIIGGTAVRANAHADFFHSLDNRTAFFQALDNIQTRLGENPPDARTKSAFPSSENETQELADIAINSRGWEEESPVNRDTSRPPANLPCASVFVSLLTVCSIDPAYRLASAQSPQPKSRWEEIRAEHARSIATRSSWDELRQNASRPKAETAEGVPNSPRDPAAEQLAEQQKFDAMLEAERRIAAEGSQGSSWGSSI